MSERRMQTLREIATACDLGPISTVWARYLNESLDAYRDEKARADAAEARIAALLEAVIVPANGNDWQCVYCLIWAATKEAIAHEPECVIRALNPE
jgi:hypothetical protein